MRLLGEYGMGKTTTARRSRAICFAGATGRARPFADLPRLAPRRRERTPRVGASEILELILKRS